ncbi:MAG TPA: hypothetical protein VFN57_08535 [Thermomicrobiaceae bacterium]|nr:hypothetical protein [Thermomicrobiaceae bacterium]
MEKFETYIGTASGVHRLGGSGAESLGLADERISAVHAFRAASGDTVVLAGSYGDGLFRSADGGRSWQPIGEGLTAPAFRTIAPDPTRPGAILAGTEPGRIFRSEDEGRSWRELDGIRAIPAHEEWYLPYSPRAGAVRNVYSPPGSDSRLLASVEVGGLLDSPDGGLSWTISPIGPDDDIHYVTGHPDQPNLLFAALGYAALKSRHRDESSPRLGGVGRSRDGGKTWQVLHTDYTRAVIVPPTHHELLLAGPSPQVGRMGRIEVSRDFGDSWEPAAGRLQTPMEDMVEVFQAAPDGSIWAVCSGGRLLRAEPEEWQWRSALPAGLGARVEAASFLPA